MTMEQFRSSLKNGDPPAHLSPALAGLWWDAKGDWNKAHESTQQDEGPDVAWVHAYLHRKEGDTSNAAYWYGQAGKRPTKVSLEEVWNEIVNALLNLLR